LPPVEVYNLLSITTRATPAHARQSRRQAGSLYFLIRMNASDTTKLIAGPYRMPRCTVERWLRCLRRGTVKVRGIHEAPIQWPYTLPRNGGGRPILILCGDLARAVRTESTLAICHWWGVKRTTVWKWRQALGVEPHTDGTLDLKRRQAPDTVRSEKSNRRRRKADKSPERRAKLVAAFRGRKRASFHSENSLKWLPREKVTAKARRTKRGSDR
jgi:hypothetical protein